MCCRYYMEMSPELRPIIEEANRSALKERTVDKLGRPLITEGDSPPNQHCASHRAKSIWRKNCVSYGVGIHLVTLLFSSD